MQTITLPIASLDHIADLATTNGTEFDEEIVLFVDEAAEQGEPYGVSIDEVEQNEEAGLLLATVEYRSEDELREWMMEVDPDLSTADLDVILAEAT